MGRYGDPVNPNADMAAMAKLRSYVKPGGVAFLAVPVGADAVFWVC